MKSFILFFILFSLWLLMSGHYNVLIISLGIISCAFCVYVAKRGKLIDDEGLPIFFMPRLLNYLIWLFKEILKSNLSTAKVIINGKVEPETFTVKTSQVTDVAKVTYANSITLTPGTVTTKIQKGVFEVHALNSDFGNDVRTNEMDKKVTWLEGKK
jgi:multicomponent Na+:H+ antiporter subunit E